MLERFMLSFPRATGSMVIKLKSIIDSPDYAYLMYKGDFQPRRAERRTLQQI